MKSAVNEIKSNPAWRELEEVNDSLKQSHNWADTTYTLAKWLYKNINAEEVVHPYMADVERQKTWEQSLVNIKAELIPRNDWFDSVRILSSWLYQNIRVGHPDFNIDQTFGNDFNKWSDTIGTLTAEWFYNINNSDSVVSDCGSHCFFAGRLYEYFNIKSYRLSLRRNSSRSVDGHMINVIQNPHNYKWYPIDHMFGLRWLHHGEWLDMETYMKLSKEQLCSIDVEPFGTFKFQIYESPFAASLDCCYEDIEVVWVEPGNHKNYYRIIAPYTLRKRFAQFKPTFDAIAASYEMPPHVDWIDLARRMPLYSSKLYSTLRDEEQPYADSLLAAWKKEM